MTIVSTIISYVIILVPCAVISPPNNDANSATTSAPFNPESLAQVLYNCHLS
jgi:hypothetical protein